MKRRPDLVLELEAAAAGRIAGVDEAGRGPLAGPVFAAAVMFLVRPDAELATRIDDSKRLSAVQRAAAYRLLDEAHTAGRVAIGVGAASVAEIGRLISDVLDGLKAANSDEGNAAVEAAVRDRVAALCGRFPLYPYLG